MPATKKTDKKIEQMLEGIRAGVTSSRIAEELDITRVTLHLWKIQHKEQVEKAEKERNIWIKNMFRS